MPTTLPRALLFDLDDTLIVFDGTTKPAWEKTCAEFAPRTGIPAETLYRAIRGHARWYWSDPERHRQGRLMLEDARREFVTESLHGLGVGDQHLAHQLADRYSALQESFIELFPDALRVLDFFTACGTRLALVTNGHAAMQRRKIDRFRLGRYFKYIFIEGELGFGKPDPRVFTAALEALGAKPEETWCVGDNLEWDVAGAQAVGIIGIWKNTYRKTLNGSPVKPDRVILELSELIDPTAASGV